MASMTLDLPLPLGPTTEVKDCIISLKNLEHLHCSSASFCFAACASAVQLLLTPRTYLMERPNVLSTCIRLEVLQHHLTDHQTRLCLLCRHICSTVWEESTSTGPSVQVEAKDQDHYLARSDSGTFLTAEGRGRTDHRRAIVGAEQPNNSFNGCSWCSALSCRCHAGDSQPEI